MTEVSNFEDKKVCVRDYYIKSNDTWLRQRFSLILQDFQMIHDWGKVFTS